MSEAASRIAQLTPKQRELLLRRLGRQAGPAEESRPARIPRQPRAAGEPGRFPVSFSQLREWILHQIEPGSSAYNIPGGVRARGPLSIPRIVVAVQEIVRVPDELTRIPRAPAFVEGVINLRGVVLPVIDQRRRFNLAQADRSDRQRIMVFTVRGVQTGFIVDSVSEVMRISAKAIGEAPNLSDAQTRLIRRVANLESQKRMVLLLDTMQLLDTQEAAAVRLSTH